jgi:hypothetical protein
MGATGSFFDPPVLSAELGDVVTFVFESGNHSATQSSFETPCLPLEGGFNSGIVSALDPNQPVRSWSLTITTVSERAFYSTYHTTVPNGFLSSDMVFFSVYEATVSLCSWHGWVWLTVNLTPFTRTDIPHLQRHQPSVYRRVYCLSERRESCPRDPYSMFMFHLVFCKLSYQNTLPAFNRSGPLWNWCLCHCHSISYTGSTCSRLTFRSDAISHS